MSIISGMLRNILVRISLVARRLLLILKSICRARYVVDGESWTEYERFSIVRCSFHTSTLQETDNEVDVAS